MKDNRSGKDKQKPVKGAVDKAGGNKGMPKPRSAAAKPAGESGKSNTGKPARTAGPTAGARPTKLAPRPERPTTAGQRPTATRPTPTKTPPSAPPKSPQASTSSTYMDMLNQMRSQASSAQNMGPLSSTSF